ncbi:hypothetical protein HDU85_002689 [Gaertneriomyces sp. JEL0708]|nr:hypothetical protein HDU85_002689 [Gaertneriomyces sp. JEL0708]
MSQHLLRAQQPPIFQSRTCRMATIVQNGIAHAHALGVQNAKDIIPMLHWNEAHNIRFLRLSSEMFPFASHEVHGYNIADVPGAKEVLQEVTQLASPRPEVVCNAIRDLEYHCQILDLIGADQDSVLIIHMGGVYGDKAATIARFHENWVTVPPHVQKRIVLENDEICYSVEDLLPTCENILPSSLPTLEYIPRINAIWHARKIRVKQHYSEGRPGAVTPMQRRAHSDRVKQMPPCEPDVDLMIEAKDKGMAVFGLMRVLGWEVEEGLPVSAERQKELAKLAKRATKKVSVAKADEDDEIDGGPYEAYVEPTRKKRKKKADAAVEDDSKLIDEDLDGRPTSNKPKRRPKTPAAVDDEPRKSSRKKAAVNYEGEQQQASCSNPFCSVTACTAASTILCELQVLLSTSHIWYSAIVTLRATMEAQVKELSIALSDIRFRAYSKDADFWTVLLMLDNAVDMFDARVAILRADCEEAERRIQGLQASDTIGEPTTTLSSNDQGADDDIASKCSDGLLAADTSTASHSVATEVKNLLSNRILDLPLPESSPHFQRALELAKRHYRTVRTHYAQRFAQSKWRWTITRKDDVFKSLTGLSCFVFYQDPKFYHAARMWNWWFGKTARTMNMELNSVLIKEQVKLLEKRYNLNEMAQAVSPYTSDSEWTDDDSDLPADASFRRTLLFAHERGATSPHVKFKGAGLAGMWIRSGGAWRKSEVEREEETSSDETPRANAEKEDIEGETRVKETDARKAVNVNGGENSVPVMVEALPLQNDGPIGEELPDSHLASFQNERKNSDVEDAGRHSQVHFLETPAIIASPIDEDKHVWFDANPVDITADAESSTLHDNDDDEKHVHFGTPTTIIAEDTHAPSALPELPPLPKPKSHETLISSPIPQFSEPDEVRAPSRTLSLSSVRSRSPPLTAPPTPPRPHDSSDSLNHHPHIETFKIPSRSLSLSSMKSRSPPLSSAPTPPRRHDSSDSFNHHPIIESIRIPSRTLSFSSVRSRSPPPEAPPTPPHLHESDDSDIESVTDSMRNVRWNQPVVTRRQKPAWRPAGISTRFLERGGNAGRGEHKPLRRRRVGRPYGLAHVVRRRRSPNRGKSRKLSSSGYANIPRVPKVSTGSWRTTSSRFISLRGINSWTLSGPAFGYISHTLTPRERQSQKHIFHLLSKSHRATSPSKKLSLLIETVSSLPRLASHTVHLHVVTHLEVAMFWMTRWKEEAVASAERASACVEWGVRDVEVRRDRSRVARWVVRVQEDVDKFVEMVQAL